MSKRPWLDDEVTIDWARIAARPNQIFGTSGDDRLRGTDGDDDFQAYQGGTDRLHGGGGNDRFYLGASLDATDRIHGGDGVDHVQIGGPYPKLVITSMMLDSVEKLSIVGSEPFDIVIQDGLGDLAVVQRPGGKLTFDAEVLTTGSVHVRSGARDDTITGGHQNDRIFGGGGADVLTGGEGNDKFVFGSTLASDPRFGSDVITDFSKGDVAKLPWVDGVYHFGETADRTGDIIVLFSQPDNRTMVSVFSDSDDQTDMIFYLNGDHSHLELRNDTSLVDGPSI